MTISAKFCIAYKSVRIGKVKLKIVCEIMGASILWTRLSDGKFLFSKLHYVTGFMETDPNRTLEATR